MDYEAVCSQTREARKPLIDEIRKELLGPGSEYSIPDEEHEIITDLPEVRYSVGILFPQKEKFDADNDNSMRPTESTDYEIEDLSLEDKEASVPEGNIKTYRKEAISEADEDTLDEEIGLASQNMPSSMGYTFIIKGDSRKINFDLEFGSYRKTKIEDCIVPFTDEDENYQLPEKVNSYVRYDKQEGYLRLITPMKRAEIFKIFEADKIESSILMNRLLSLCNQFGRNGFVRRPHKATISVNFAAEDYVNIVIRVDEILVKLTALRQSIGKEMYAITVMLVNMAEGKYNGSNSIFQPSLKVTAEYDDNYTFCEYSNYSSDISNDEEEQSLELLYRNKHVYGTGHGTSLEWSIDEKGYGYIVNSFFPLKEVPQVDFSVDVNSGIDPRCLSMKFLSDLSQATNEEKKIAITTLINSYSKWIDKIENEINDINSVPSRLQPIASKHISDCRESCRRMYKGISILFDGENEKVRQAFVLANRAMFMQRIHLRIQAKDKYPNDLVLQKRMKEINYYEENDDYTWRPFQLAFLLMSLRSVIDPNCPERNIVDLIWFPTGGGKTEAYLGLTAFTIFFRRLEHIEESGGTSVIMRYTLRLLAAQQFIRAATLICACEAIRKDGLKKNHQYPTYNLGREDITIGLWIGSEHTPNRNIGTKSAMEYFDAMDKASKTDIRYAKDRYNKFQVLKCPWCGTKMVKDSAPSGKKLLGEWGYKFTSNNKFYLNCPQLECKFENKLPIQIVDEELYRNPPTLLFGTVDKFAMLPWKKAVGSFFASDSSNRAPELIIQDELHLISGPLGTMVGLYETAVDALCSAKGIKPKIIASTATIRRAKDQCSVLYNRDVQQFPAQGINAEDSYFARESDICLRNGRVYIGLMPSGKTKAMMEVRTIAAILQRVNMMKLPDEIKDKFWTLAIYFNSLKDLGKCSTLLDDDVKDFIKRTAYRFGLGRGRIIANAAELTSRVSTSELNETLEKLERLEYSKSNIEEKRYAVNTLLATNMISVGVDVARLNVMLLVGQPKLTSEYIQASSRIGREYSGVAFTLYDGAKSRDRSHFEQFKAYHESFYRYVEPTGATPFSKPARERALHAVIISLLRHKYGLSQDKDASQFDKKSNQIELKEIREYIINRVKEIHERTTPNLDDDTDEILAEIESFYDEWEERVEIANHDNFYYGDKFMFVHPAATEKRLIKVFGEVSQDTAKDTLTSMRNVDKNIASSILIWEDNL